MLKTHHVCDRRCSRVRVPPPSAQDKEEVTTADFAGTWNIEAMSHPDRARRSSQPTGNKVTATMMMMGTRHAAQRAS